MNEDQVTGSIEPVLVESIVIADSPRQLGTDCEHVYRLLHADPAELPPILIHRDSMKVIDGMHRVKAAQARGDRTIAAAFFDGDETEAFIRAVRLNTTHGLPLTIEDRKAAAARIIAMRPHLSDRVIGTYAGLSGPTVAAVRHSSTQAVESSTRTGADGRSRPLRAAEGRRRAAELISARPDAPLREIAAKAGVSVGTAHDVRKRMLRGEDPVTPRQRSGSEETPCRVDTDEILQVLRRDPVLRNSDWGRTLLRWLHSHGESVEAWSSYVDVVPPHHIDHVVQMARQFASDWSGFASSLERRESH